MFNATIKKWSADKFWRNNVIFLVGSLLVAFLNYLYYPVLGRLMEISSFGEVQTLLSILNLIGVLLGAFQIVIINIAANDIKKGAKTIRQFERLAFMLMLVVSASIIMAASRLQHFFSFESYVPFVIIGVAPLFSVLIVFRSAYIQGKSNFLALSAGNSIGAFSKLVISALLVVAGFSTFGATGGIVIAQMLMLAYMTRAAQKMGYAAADKDNTSRFSLPQMSLLKPQMRYLLSVMAVFFTVTLLYSADILVVKRYFDPEIAGQYAGVSAIAKIIFFATASFSGVLLASVGKAFSAEHNKRVSRRSLALVATAGGLTLLLFALAPEFIITTLVGSRYAGYAHLLPSIGLVVFLVSLINLCFYYFLALRQYIIVPIAIIGGLSTFLLTLLRHNSLEMIIQDFLAGSLLILILIAGLSASYRVKFSLKTGL